MVSKAQTAEERVQRCRLDGLEALCRQHKGHNPAMLLIRWPLAQADGVGAGRLILPAHNNNMNTEIDEWELNKVAHFLVKHNSKVFYRGVESCKSEIRSAARSVPLRSFHATTGYVIFRCNNESVKIAIDSCILPNVAFPEA